MSEFSKTVFPACASFGPTMIAMGCMFPNRDGVPYGLIMALPGALMTTAALLIIFRALNHIDETTSTPQPSAVPK